ncbi:MAG TPA: cytochrome c [Gemmatimonadaceae bacterium]|nr:cytochrome c [Gemmatimonadaceae bacterium]
MTDPTSREREAFGGAESDVEQIHRQIVRELADPAEGYERVPWFLWVTVATMVFWAGWYIGRRGGTFDTRTHIEYAAIAPDGVASVDSASSGPVDAVAEGKRIFGANCSACHQATGLGVAGAFPPIVGSEWVTGPEATVVRILLNGLGGPLKVKGATYNGAMPAWKESMTDAEISYVITYIRQWAPNAAPAVTPATVGTLRKEHESRSGPWTEGELKALESAPAVSVAAPAAAAESKP